jgi:transcription initiation factor TFIIIB Brf1 subunit/transcription initiation factor TFIIB
MEANNSLLCFKCKSDGVFEDHSSGDVVCQNCGAVQDRVIDEGAEWRNFEDEPDNHARAEVMDEKWGLGTFISETNFGSDKISK